MSTSNSDLLDALSLSALMSSRLCHDLVNPVGALASGLDVLNDPDCDEGMREAAIDLVRGSAEKSIALLKFARLAYGAAGGFGAMLPLDEAKNVLSALVATTKAELDWRLAPGDASKEKVKALLIIGAAAAESIPRGGVVVIDGEGDKFTISASGQRAFLQDDLVRALALDAEDMKPKFAPYYMVAMLAQDAGGSIDARLDGETIVFTIDFKEEASALTAS